MRQMQHIEGVRAPTRKEKVAGRTESALACQIRNRYG